MKEAPRNGEEDDNNRDDATHWRNAFWARQRGYEDWMGDPDNFGGSFRGVPAVPHGGVAHVTAEDTLGADELCWCGRPLNHMWPGRTVGSRHPSEDQMKTMTAHVDRRDFRGYHKTIQDFLLHCINEDQLRFRIAKSSVILYPPDGTQPATVYARNSERQLRHLTKWYAQHVKEGEEQDEQGVASAEQIETLAEAVNDPDEHPHDKRLRDVEDVELPEAAETEDEDPVAPPEEEPEPEAEVEEERPEKEEWQPDQWHPMLMQRGTNREKESPNIEERTDDDGVRHFRCRLCMDTDHPLESTNPRSTGGHNRIYHTEGVREQMYSPEARAKAVATRQERVALAKVEEAVTILNTVLGKSDHQVRMEDLEARAGELEVENAALRKQVGDLEARIALMKEAFQGL